jgi:hypothetical protein
MIKTLLHIFIAVTFGLCLIGCSSTRGYPPEIQVRYDVENFKQVGKVSFVHFGYKGVFRIKLIDEIQGQDVTLITKEITEKYDCSLIKPAVPGVENPNIKSGLIYIKDASDETVIEISKEERIKFIAQHYPDH